MPQRDWFEWVLGISQVVGAFATAAAGFFAGVALRANKRDRIEREKPFLVIKTGRYVEAPVPEGVDHPSFRLLTENPGNKVDAILFNAGNGPLVDLSMSMSFRLEDDEENVLAHKPLRYFLSEGVIANGDHLSTSEIISEANFFIHTIDNGVVQEKIKNDPDHYFRLRLVVEAIYCDKGRNYYTQTFAVAALTTLYELLETAERTFASDCVQDKNLAVESRTLRIREANFYYVTPQGQIEVSTLPKKDHRRWYIENRFKSPEELQKAKIKAGRWWRFFH